MYVKLSTCVEGGGGDGGGREGREKRVEGLRRKSGRIEKEERIRIEKEERIRIEKKGRKMFIFVMSGLNHLMVVCTVLYQT